MPSRRLTFNLLPLCALSSHLIMYSYTPDSTLVFVETEKLLVDTLQMTNPGQMNLSRFFFHSDPLLIDITLVVSLFCLVSIEYWHDRGMPHIASAEGDKMNYVHYKNRLSK